MSARRLPRLNLIPSLVLVLALGGSALQVRAQESIANCTSATNLIDAISRTNYIVFACSGTIVVTNPIIISGEVTLDATDRTVELHAGNTNRIFNVQPGGSLTLINLVLTGGKAAQGGAIRNQGILVATNCVFAGNNASGANGAAGANGKDDGTRPTNGGDGQPGVAGLGGAIWNSSTLVLARCTFATNAATGGNGGAGGNGGNGINGSFISGDGGNGGAGAAGRGGAVYTVSTNATITECVFHKNTVTGGNGGAFGAPGTGGLPAKPGQAGQGAAGTGAAVYNALSLAIDSSTFSENRADGGDSPATAGESSNGNGNNGLNGGEAWGGGVCNISTLYMTNSTFSTNRVFGGDGAKGADGSIRGGRGGNGGTAYGGNLYNNGGSTIINCTFVGGAARGGTNGVGGAGPTPGGAGTAGANRGGNLAAVGGALGLKNTIVGRPGLGANGYGAVVDSGFNISSDTSIVLGSSGSRVNTPPRIGGLEDNGGFGRTFALLSGSPAIDGGDPNDSPEVDQRGFPKFGDYRDVGAYEFASSSITVHVTDVDGIGIAGVQIAVSGAATNLTDADGNFKFPPLPAGDYTVTPVHSLYTFDPPFETVTLGPAMDLTFTAKRTFSVSGYVRDDVSPIDNVTVTIGSEQAVTDTNGFYEVTGLDAGAYNVQPSSPGYAFAPSLQPINLQADTTNVNFTAVGIYSISGRITEGGRGLANVTVHAGNRSAVTGSSGDYTIAQLPRRSQTVTPFLAGYSFSPPSLTLIPTTDENGIDFVGFPSFQVSGVVLNTSNNLGANAVTLTLRTNSPSGTSTILLSDTNGLFTFTNVLPGSYVLTPTKTGHAFLPPTNTLTLGPGVTNLTYKMYPAFTMGGRVTASGASLSNATIIVRTNGGAELARVTTGVNGIYSFNPFPVGTYELIPSLAGYDFTPTNRFVALTGNSNNLDFASTGVFSISGQVTKNGSALPNVTVRCSGGISVTDASGRYALLNLPPGNYTVTPDDPRYGFQPSSAAVALGPSRTDVNFVAVDVYTINGEVLEGGIPLVGAQVAAGGVTNFTGDLGRYTLSHVPAGSNVIVAASMSGYEFTPQQQSIVLDSPKNGVNFSARGLSAISGRVTDAVTSNGIGSVKITVAGRYETNTSVSGFYVLTNIGPGFLNVVPSRTNRGFTPISQVVNVPANSTATNVNFAAFRASKLFGRIYDEFTNGLVSVSVRAESIFGTNTVTTDTNGNYVFPVLRNAFYKLTPSKFGLGFNPHFYDLDLTADSQRDFLGFPGFAIAGRITDGVSPVVGMQVNVNTIDIDSTVTDNNGNYALTGLPEGDYTVTPVGIGYDVTPGGRQLTLGPTNATGMNFIAQGNLAVLGHVLEGSVGVSNIQIRLTSTNTPPFARTVNSDTTGAFTFSNLPPGNVSIQPTLSDLFTPTSIVLNPLSYAAPNFNANPPVLGISRSTNGVKVTLRALPTRAYTLQTNLNAGVTSWVDYRRSLSTDANGLLEHFPPTNVLSSRTLLFRARR